jgi:general secretion pathway protein K
VALITILLLLAVMATLAIYSAEEQDLAIRRVSNLVTAEQGFQVNLSGEQWVVKVLEADLDSDAANSSGDQPVLDHQGETWGNLGPPVEVGKTGMTLWMLVDDQQSRININNLLQGREQGQSGGGPGNGSDDDSDAGGNAANDDEEADPDDEDPNEGETVVVSDEDEEEEEKPVLWYQVMQNLFAGLKLNPELVFPLMDWVDGDEDPIGTTGAEDFYYSGLDLPYRAANRAMTSAAEMAQVKDFDAGVMAALLPWVSALPLAGAGNPIPVNVNTASPRVLAAFSLDQPLDPESLTPLIERRKAAPFSSLEEFNSEFEVLAPGGLVQGYENMLSVSSDFYAGRSCARSGQVKFSMTSLLQKSMADKKVRVLQRERFFGCPLFPDLAAEDQ